MNMNKIKNFFIADILIFLTACHSFPSNTIENFKVKDTTLFPINNFSFQLSDFKDSKGLIIALRNKECPANTRQGEFLSQLEKEYMPKGIKFIYSYTASNNFIKNAQEDLNHFKFKGYYVIDRELTLAKNISARTSKNIFILTPNLQLIHRGSLGNKSQITKLKAVLNQILLGKTPSINTRNKDFASPFNSCLISFPEVRKEIFYEDIAPIIQNKCVNCHSQRLTSIDFVDYESIYGRRAMIKHVIKNNLMPPWFVDDSEDQWKDNFRLTAIEKAMFLKWINTGLPYKTKKSRLRPFKIKQTKTILNPDYIIKPKKPVALQVPPSGYVPYQNFFIEADFEKDKYVKEYEFVTKFKIAHHFLLYVFDRKMFSHLKGNYSWGKVISCKTTEKKSGVCVPVKYDIIAWTAGRKKYRNLGPNMGVRIPKKALFLFQMHYEPIGKTITDDESHLKLKFHSKTPKYKRITSAIIDLDIKIPPHHPNFLHEMRYTTKTDLKMNAISSHMHLRGKASSISILDPKGKEKKIMRWAPYYYQLQDFYYFKEPLLVKKDSTIICRNWLDNSGRNPVNPNPDEWVKWGSALRKEMSSCVFEWTIPPLLNPYDKDFF